jgi:hypothetical protein
MVGAEQKRKNVILVNEITTLQAEHARVSPLRFLNEYSEKKKRNTL